LWLESKPGAGSIFHFTTVLKPAMTHAERHDASEKKSLQGLSVLVVEHSPTDGAILSEMLRNWRMNPTLAGNGGEGLEALRSARKAGRSFPILLIDAHMPDSDGFDLAGDVLSDPEVGGSVIMMLTADRNLADAVRCRELGVAAQLIKPVGQSELLDTLLTICGDRPVKDRIAEHLNSTERNHRWQPLNILLAEDNVVNQKLAIRLLEKKGQKVVLATTGTEVLAALNHSDVPDFDLVLMDIQMPEMDGMKATAAIRLMEQTSGKHLPIIAMTAHAMSGDREGCLNAGMDGYISKPIRTQDLYAEIERCLPGILLETADIRSNFAPLETIDRAMLLARVEGDHKLFVELIQLFLEDAPRMIAAMRRACEEEAMDALAKSAHSMKGAAGSLAAETTAEAAAQLERYAVAGDVDRARESLATLEAMIGRLVPVLIELCHGVAT
jgi:two-component system sensor histidine kinase/response regulator